MHKIVKVGTRNAITQRVSDNLRSNLIRIELLFFYKM